MRTCSEEANDVCSFVADGSPKIDDLYPCRSLTLGMMVEAMERGRWEA